MTFFKNLEFKDLLLFILIIFTLCKVYQLEQKTNIVEGLTDETVKRIIKPLTDEALQSIASVYDDSNLTLPPTTVTGKMIVTGDLEVTGKIISNELNVSGKTDLNGGAVINNFYPGQGVLTIKSPIGTGPKQTTTRFGYPNGYNYITSKNGTVIRGNSNGLIDMAENGPSYIKNADNIKLKWKDQYGLVYCSEGSGKRCKDQQYWASWKNGSDGAGLTIRKS
jgi:hypothetical protein